jgi:pimeloyl-ACP methyl ester carboxylesterase
VERILGIPGAGSTPEFLRSIFPHISQTIDHRTSSAHNISAVLSDSPIDVLIGMSYGAHLSAIYAATRIDIAGLILLTPAWTGQPSDGHQHFAADVEHEGVEAALNRLPDEPAWIAHELRQAWTSFEETTLIHHLKQAAHASGPTYEELRRIRCPTVIVGLIDDVVHPHSVAADWHRHIPHSRLISLPVSSPDLDLHNLGTVALANLADLRATFKRIR